MEQVLEITFSVAVHEAEHWNGPRGTADCRVTIPRAMLAALDMGNAFAASLQAALTVFDASLDADDER